jgi:Rha family phage regulatory protein
MPKGVSSKVSKDLTIINRNGQLLVDSREVAEMIDRPHYDLMKSIRQYCEYLTQGDFPFSDFFIESTYQDSTGRILPCYLLTRKGCDMVANKMTGEKGVLFSATYVSRFEEMEKYLTENRKYEIFPETDNEHLKIAYTLINSLHSPNIGKGAQKEIGRAITHAIKLSGVSSRNQKPLPGTDEPTPGDLLNKLLSHAVPLISFIPESEAELKSSILYDDQFYYIFPLSIEKYIDFPGAKNVIFHKIRALGGQIIGKRFRVGKKNKPYKCRRLPRRAARGSSNVIAFPG